jgi:aminopeptidase
MYGDGTGFGIGRRTASIFGARMNSTFQTQLEHYAHISLKLGLGFQSGQRLLIRANLETAQFTRLLVREAYQQGAQHVAVFWTDEEVTLARHQLAPRDSFQVLPDWQSQLFSESVGRGDALLIVDAENPNLLAGMDTDLIALEQRTRMQGMQPALAITRSNKTNWCVIAAATPAWANCLFPNLDSQRALEQLWNLILRASGMQTNHPEAFWNEQASLLHERRTMLNHKRFDRLRFFGDGTNLEVGLVHGHIWDGGAAQTLKGISFLANLPTYEVYTMPHRERTNGVAHGTKSALLSGVMVDGWTLEFKDGRVIRASAEQGETALHTFLEADAGARHLGEVALLPAKTPVALTGVLFYATLLDENAACHIALGQAYPVTLEGGSTMTEEEFRLAGGNTSNEHHDFMIGSSGVDVTGLHTDGREEKILEQGSWVLLQD